MAVNHPVETADTYSMRIVMFCLSLLFFAPLAEAKRIVMLTGFEPFGGRSTNNSALAIEALAKSGLGARDGIEYKICILPVEYDKAAKKAQECYEQMNPKPNMVISTGEGDCTVRLEVRAHNLDSAPFFPDNAGVIRDQKKIESSAPEHELLTLPVPDLYCTGIAEMGPPMSASLSPGYFVCNNTAFHMARYLKPKKIPFGFVHVPPAGGECRGRPEPVATRLHSLVRTILRALSLSTSVFAEPGGALAPNAEDSANLSNMPPPFVSPGCRERLMTQNRLALERERQMQEQFQQMPRSGDIAGPAASPAAARKKAAVASQEEQDGTEKSSASAE